MSIFNFIEPAVGEVFFRDGQPLTAVVATDDDNQCAGCVYEHMPLAACSQIVCNSDSRHDGQNIIIIPNNIKKRNHNENQ